jgi:hypothetical protein
MRNFRRSRKLKRVLETANYTKQVSIKQDPAQRGMFTTSLPLNRSWRVIVAWLLPRVDQSARHRFAIDAHAELNPELMGSISMTPSSIRFTSCAHWRPCGNWVICKPPIAARFRSRRRMSVAEQRRCSTRK